MNKKSISIFCAILMIIGTALPWTSMQATSSFFDSETSLSGLKFTEGILGLIAAIAGIGLVYFNKSVDRHINLTNRLLRRFCRGLSNDLENVRNSLLCVSILSRDPFQIQRYEFSLNLQKYSVQVLYKTKARGYEPRTFFPFISCYHVGWFRRRVAIRLKGFSANYEK